MGRVSDGVRLCDHLGAQIGFRDQGSGSGTPKTLHANRNSGIGLRFRPPGFRGEGIGLREWEMNSKLDL